VSNVTCDACVVQKLTDLRCVWLDVTQKGSKIATKIVSIADQVKSSLLSLADRPILRAFHDKSLVPRLSCGFCLHPDKVAGLRREFENVVKINVIAEESLGRGIASIVVGYNLFATRRNIIFLRVL